MRRSRLRVRDHCPVFPLADAAQHGIDHPGLAGTGGPSDAEVLRLQLARNGDAADGHIGPVVALVEVGSFCSFSFEAPTIANCNQLYVNILPHC